MSLEELSERVRVESEARDRGMEKMHTHHELDRESVVVWEEWLIRVIDEGGRGAAVEVPCVEDTWKLVPEAERKAKRKTGTSPGGRLERRKRSSNLSIGS